MGYIGADPALNESVTAAQIVDGTIVAADVASNAITNAKMADDAVGVAELSASGTASNSTFLRGDNAWAAPSGVALTGSTNNQVVTVTGADAIAGESGLIFDGTHLGISVTDASGDPSAPESMQSNHIALRMGEQGSLFINNTDHAMTVSTNLYRDATDSRWEIIGTGRATDYYQYNGEHNFRCSTASQSANEAYAAKTVLKLENGGKFQMGSNLQFKEIARGTVSINSTSNTGTLATLTNPSVFLAFAAYDNDHWNQTMYSCGPSGTGLDGVAVLDSTGTNQWLASGNNIYLRNNTGDNLSGIDYVVYQLL